MTDSSGTTVSDTKYTYDGTSTTATSGTPQHTSPISSPLNLTQVQQWVSGTTYLTSNTSYYDTGNVYQSKDVNTNVTTYTYNSSSCGNSFPTGTSVPTGGGVTLTTSATWNCTGGVQSASYDLNGNETLYNYGSDPYWRPQSVTNVATGAITDYTYPTTSTNGSSVTLSFNSGNSASNSYSTYDGLGRTIAQQTAESSSGSPTYDTVNTGYDALGRVAFQTLPYASTTLGNYSSSEPGVSTTYDALNRSTQVTDGGGGYTQYTYSYNDVLSTVGPQVTTPATENLKKRNLQYNGAGWLTSVCEVVTSTSPAGGACGQTASYTGYLTKYTYDGAGRLTQSQQNAQSARLDQHPDPESLLRRSWQEDPRDNPGVERRWHDGGNQLLLLRFGTPLAGSASTGDLVASQDAMTNVTCVTYDALHRPLRSWVNSGTYSSVTPNTYAVYDAATYSGTAMQNAKGAVAEAYTSSGACPSPCSSKLTDIYFSTSPSTSGATTGGVLKQTWEATPHSGNYYHLEEYYYPNGVVGLFGATLGGVGITVPAITYGVDGEGRPYSATESSHNLVTATTYNPASSPLSLTFGNGDSDSFTYDPNTYRPASLTATITPTSEHLHRGQRTHLERQLFAPAIHLHGRQPQPVEPDVQIQSRRSEPYLLRELLEWQHH